MGPVRATVAEAQRDVEVHGRLMVAQGGFGDALVVRRDEGGAGDRCETLDGVPVWPPHGRSTGAVRWAAP